LLRIFRTMNPVSLLLAMVYFSALSAHLFLHPVHYQSEGKQYIELLLYHDWLQMGTWNNAVYTGVLLGLIFLTGLYISRAAAIARFTPQLSLLPAIAFYTMVFLLEEAAPHINALILLLIILRIFILTAKSYNQQHVDGRLLDAGFWCGVLGLLNMQALLFFIVIQLGFSTLRTLSLRESFVILAGAVAAHFLAGTAFFFTGNLDAWLNMWSEALAWPPMHGVSWVTATQLGLWACFLLAALLFVNSRYNSQLIQFRRYVSILLLFFTAGMAVAVLQVPGFLSLSWLLCGLSAFFLAWWWQQMKNQEAAAIVHLTMLGLVFVFQYINFAV
jgi:hypothetical protein